MNSYSSAFVMVPMSVHDDLLMLSFDRDNIKCHAAMEMTKI